MGLEFEYKKGQTSLDSNEINGLKISTISTQDELNEFEQLNIEKAIIWSMNKKMNPDYILSEYFVRQLHVKMFGDIWAWAGEFRKTDKNIGVHWPLIATKLKQLVEDTKFWIENETFPKEEVAIRFKHRIVSIHGFPNGNGRHSRLMADIINERIFGNNVFSWCRNDSRDNGKIRAEYIEALRQADNHDISALLKFSKG